MSDFKDDFFSTVGIVAEKARDLAYKTADATKDLAMKASEKAAQIKRTAKLNIEISTEKDAIRKAYTELGKLYYETHKDDAEGYFAQLCDEIELSMKNIAEKEAEIADIKASSDIGDDTFEVEFEEAPADEEPCCEGEGVTCCCGDEAAPLDEDDHDLSADGCEDSDRD